MVRSTSHAPRGPYAQSITEVGRTCTVREFQFFSILLPSVAYVVSEKGQEVLIVPGVCSGPWRDSRKQRYVLSIACLGKLIWTSVTLQ